MIDVIKDGYAEILNTLWLLPNWLTASTLVIGGILVALIANAMIVHAIRSTLGVRHPKTRSLLTRSKGPLRLALIVLALSLVVRVAPIGERAAIVFSNVLNVAFIALLGWTALIAAQIGSQVYLRRFSLEAEDNLLARKHVTQVGILKRAADTLIVIMTVAAAMMSFEQVRQYGVSLFASAGVAGLAIGIAARPLLANLIAGVQIAVAQPIRLDDVVFLEGEYGTIEEITTTYVVIKLWDWRRMVVPLSYFIEKPFQNWTRETSALIGSVFLYVDYTVPVEKLREKLMEVARASPLWDGRVVVLQVSDATRDNTVELRALLSARSAPAAWDLRCDVREKLIAYLQEEYPGSLPRQRQEFVSRNESDQGPLSPHTMVSHHRAG
ncbi:MAG: mechanosensitive ion channel [Afipia sp.]|jgi:small-conductance mechanosensitive channel|nr:mechanosensitive ion channel [Afipia sp.]WIG51136.1 MAG: Membrane protein [Afipia sp.]